MIVELNKQKNSCHISVALKISLFLIAKEGFFIEKTYNLYCSMNKLKWLRIKWDWMGHTFLVLARSFLGEGLWQSRAWKSPQSSHLVFWEDWDPEMKSDSAGRSWKLREGQKRIGKCPDPVPVVECMCDHRWGTQRAGFGFRPFYHTPVFFICKVGLMVSDISQYLMLTKHQTVTLWKLSEPRCFILA